MQNPETSLAPSSKEKEQDSNASPQNLRGSWARFSQPMWWKKKGGLSNFVFPAAVASTGLLGYLNVKLAELIANWGPQAKNVVTGETYFSDLTQWMFSDTSKSLIAKNPPDWVPEATHWMFANVPSVILPYVIVATTSSTLREKVVKPRLTAYLREQYAKHGLSIAEKNMMKNFMQAQEIDHIAQRIEEDPEFYAENLANFYCDLAYSGAVISFYIALIGTKFSNGSWEIPALIGGAAYLLYRRSSKAFNKLTEYEAKRQALRADMRSTLMDASHPNFSFYGRDGIEWLQKNVEKQNQELLGNHGKIGNRKTVASFLSRIFEGPLPYAMMVAAIYLYTEILDMGISPEELQELKLQDEAVALAKQNEVFAASIFLVNSGFFITKETSNIAKIIPELKKLNSAEARLEKLARIDPDAELPLPTIMHGNQNEIRFDNIQINKPKEGYAENLETLLAPDSYEQIVSIGSGKPFVLNPGTYFIAGQNGVGKSSLLRTLVGQQPGSGTVILPEGTKTGYIGRNPMFPKNKTLREVLCFPEFIDTGSEEFQGYKDEQTSYLVHLLIQMQGSSLWQKLEELAHERGLVGNNPTVSYMKKALADLLDMKDIDWSGDILSDGQKTMLNLVQTLYGEPTMILMDEADSTLDIENQGTFYRLLKEYQKNRDAFVLSTGPGHMVPQNIYDRVFHIQNGRLNEPSNYPTYTLASFTLS